MALNNPIVETLYAIENLRPGTVPRVVDPLFDLLTLCEKAISLSVVKVICPNQA